MPKALFHSVYEINYHLVLVTKYRRRAITRKILDRLKEIISDRVKSWGGELKEVNAEADHVHILFSLPPKYAVSDFVNALKTASSKLIRREFKEQLDKIYWKEKGVFWSRSYFITSCGGAPLEVIMQYINHQESPEK